jgi:hypothetical protein
VPWHLDEYPNDSIVTVIIEQGVTHIGNLAFQECVGIVSVAIPDSVSSIGEGTFAGCSSLKTVTIPEGLTGIGERAFENCVAMQSVFVKDGNRHFLSDDGILFNKDKTCIMCFPAGRTGHYTAPDSVTHIGNEAFCGSSSIRYHSRQRAAYWR